LFDQSAITLRQWKSATCPRPQPEMAARKPRCSPIHSSGTRSNGHREKISEGSRQRVCAGIPPACPPLGGLGHWYPAAASRDLVLFRNLLQIRQPAAVWGKGPGNWRGLRLDQDLRLARTIAPDPPAAYSLTLRREVNDAVDRLPQCERRVILALGEGHSLREISRDLKVTPGRVSQLQQQALMMLRIALGARGIASAITPAPSLRTVKSIVSTLVDSVSQSQRIPFRLANSDFGRHESVAQSWCRVDHAAGFGRSRYILAPGLSHHSPLLPTSAF
jgi:hypothetical protein